jgi:hypothetical protein
MIEILQKDDFFNSRPPIQRRRIAHLISRIMNGEFRHKELYILAEIDAISLSASYMQEQFRGNNSGYYKDILDNYFICINSSYHFGKSGKGRTRKYKLKDWVRDDYMNHLKNSAPLELTHFNGKQTSALTSIPQNAVYDLDINGKPKATNIILPPTLELNIDGIYQTIEALENFHSIKQRQAEKDKNLIHLYQWKKALNNTLAPNRIIQLYNESDNGRLTPPKGLNIPNIINTPNRIRKVLFSDMGLYSYDMANAHFSVFNNLCKDYGLNCPNIELYLENKAELREIWSHDYYVRPKALKSYLISWLYGNNNNAVRQNSCYDDVGEYGMKAIKKDAVLSGMYNEIVNGRNLIVKTMREKKTITNILGKQRPIQDLRKDLCFILFGYETKIMEVANQFLGDDMMVYIYDGFLGKKIDVLALQNEVNEKLNLNIVFDEELVEAPPLNALS